MLDGKRDTIRGGLLVAAALAAFACTDDDGARRALEASGFTKIRLTGYEAFSCGRDSTCTGFEAIGPTGVRVTGAVGCGIGCGKGCTVRIR